LCQPLPVTDSNNSFLEGLGEKEAAGREVPGNWGRGMQRLLMHSLSKILHFTCLAFWALSISFDNQDVFVLVISIKSAKDLRGHIQPWNPGKFHQTAWGASMTK
jgi:hypothetical protein